jgi:hypothetical protein
MPGLALPVGNNKNCILYKPWWTFVVGSVSDPDPVGSAFNLGLDPDPYSESGSGFQIKVSKNRFNNSFLSLFQVLITLGNFLLSFSLLKSYHIECKFFADCVVI